MNENPNDFDFLNSVSKNFNQTENLSREEKRAINKKAKRWFIILLVIGLSLGGVLSVGVVKVLNELGLTKKPEQPILKIGK